MAIALTHPCPAATAETDPFGWRPAIPGVVAAQLHSGQDYAAAEGTPVYAAHAGRVNRVWWDTMIDGSPAGGNMLQIGAAQCSTRYAHLSDYAVAAGQEVQAGDLIGWVGSTGAANGPHLHFELLLPGGSFVDPRPYITKGKPMTQAEINAIAAAVLDAPIKHEGTDAKGRPRTGYTSIRLHIGWANHQTGLTRRIVEAIKKKVQA